MIKTLNERINVLKNEYKEQLDYVNFLTEITSIRYAIHDYNAALQISSSSLDAVNMYPAITNVIEGFDRRALKVKEAIRFLTGMMREPGSSRLK